MSSSTTSRLASVKWFSNRKGFGFLTDLESKEDVFVHHTGIKTPENVYRTLVDGEYVSYDVSTDDNNQKVATDVTGVQGGPLLCENPTKKVLLVVRDRDRQDDGGDESQPQQQRNYRPRSNYRGRGGRINRGPPKRRYERRDKQPRFTEQAETVTEPQVESKLETSN